MISIYSTVEAKFGFFFYLGIKCEGLSCVAQESDETCMWTSTIGSKNLKAETRAGSI